jgi:hypothetical protein
MLSRSKHHTGAPTPPVQKENLDVSHVTHMPAAPASQAPPASPARVAVAQHEVEPGKHAGYACDGCSAKPIVGTRHTKHPDANYDLCAACWGKLPPREQAPYRAVEAAAPRLSTTAEGMPDCVTKLPAAEGYAEVRALWPPPPPSCLGPPRSRVENSYRLWFGTRPNSGVRPRRCTSSARRT